MDTSSIFLSCCCAPAVSPVSMSITAKASCASALSGCSSTQTRAVSKASAGRFAYRPTKVARSTRRGSRDVRAACLRLAKATSSWPRWPAISPRSMSKRSSGVRSTDGNATAWETGLGVVAETAGRWATLLQAANSENIPPRIKLKVLFISISTSPAARLCLLNHAWGGHAQKGHLWDASIPFRFIAVA